MKPYFIFKKIESRDMDIVVNKLPSIYKPTKDINKIEIEGRDGFLTEDLGTYRSIIKTVECTVKNLDNIDQICSWLDGSGEVIFSNQEDRKYKATIINQIEFNKVIRQFHRFIIQFECQPFASSLNNEILTLTKPKNIINQTLYTSKPIITVYGSGNITLTINNRDIYLKNIAGYVVLDSEMMDCYKDGMLMNNNMQGEFPIFQLLHNTISWKGNVEKLTIKPNWKY